MVAFAEMGDGASVGGGHSGHGGQRDRLERVAGVVTALSASGLVVPPVRRRMVATLVDGVGGRSLQIRLDTGGVLLSDSLRDPVARGFGTVGVAVEIDETLHRADR